MSQKSAKTKKKTHLPTPTTTKPWTNLPLQVHSLLKRKPCLWRKVSSVGGVTKTWRSPSRKCSPNGKSRLPQLVEIHEKEKIVRPHTLLIRFNLKNPSLYFIYSRRSYLKHWSVGKYFQVHPHGDHVIEMVLTGSCSPAFAFYTYDKFVKDGEWILEDCTVEEPYSPGINMRFCNGIHFQGKIYGLSLQGTVVVIEEVDSCFRITGIGGNRAVPREVSGQFREYLVESEGEILLVFLVSRKSIRIVDNVEVFKLDISTLLWVELGSIGDRALFLGNETSMGIIASDVGCVKNCVYFNHDSSDVSGFSTWKMGKLNQLLEVMVIRLKNVELEMCQWDRSN